MQFSPRGLVLHLLDPNTGQLFLRGLCHIVATPQCLLPPSKVIRQRNGRIRSALESTYLQILAFLTCDGRNDTDHAMSKRSDPWSRYSIHDKPRSVVPKLNFRVHVGSAPKSYRIHFAKSSTTPSGVILNLTSGPTYAS